MRMKRATAAALILALIFAMAGCGDIFEKEYCSVTDYAAEAAPATEKPVDDIISGYAALKRVITDLVRRHVESAELKFQDYDGSVAQDISQACWEVKSSTALGAFAVDYISYDTTRIADSNKAEIFITYKRTTEQMEALETVSNLRALVGRISTALEDGETYLAVELNSAYVTAEEVKAYVSQSYYADAQAVPFLPSAEVAIFPDSGVDRIVEITFDYGQTTEELTGTRQKLSDACKKLTADLFPEVETSNPQETEFPSGTEVRQADTAYTLAQRLKDACVCDETAGATAYDALVKGKASSEGIAMAYEALCQTVGIDCEVVNGSLDGEAHFWNIVTVDGISAHVDVSRWDEGPQTVFLMTDAAMQPSYGWDASQYPVCDKNYDYFGASVTPQTEGSKA
jgi:hypothetical protein